MWDLFSCDSAARSPLLAGPRRFSLGCLASFAFVPGAAGAPGAGSGAGAGLAGLRSGGGGRRGAPNLPGCWGKEQLRGKMGAAVGMKLVIL